MEIKHGTTRVVVLTGRYAFKLPTYVQWNLFLHGLLANMQEATFSKTGWPKLCPVRFHIPGGFLTVMDRAEPLTRDEFFNLNIDEWTENGDYVIPVEAKLDSFGKLNGKIVAVDYGN